MRTCVVCGTSIEGTRWNVRLCSDECRKKKLEIATNRWRANNPERYKAQLERAKAKAAAKAKAKKEDRKCAVCGASIGHRHGVASYCSEECHVVGRNKLRSIDRKNNPDKYKKWESGRDKDVLRERNKRYRLKFSEDERRQKKREEYERNWENYRNCGKRYYSENRQAIRERENERMREMRMALKLVREMQEKGLEALL